MSDQVNSPSHYISDGLECIDVIRAFLGPEKFEGYCHGNVIKYVLRYPKKGGVEDLQKARVYLKYMIDELSVK